MKSRPPLGWDVHAHLIPGVDDGMRTIDEALEAVIGLQELGYSGCIVTPHIYREVHDNDAVRLRKAFDQFCVQLHGRGIEFDLRLAAEYFADDDLVAQARSGSLLSFGGVSRHVLIEFPYVGEPLNWADALSAVTRAGYCPVIAHPERYRYFAANPDKWLQNFASYPVRYQCEIGSLAGQYGPEAKRIAKYLHKRRIATLWGTDLHRPDHIQRFIRPGLESLKVRGVLNPGLAGGTS